jgi:N-carbamoyl-L-amino-acid hydrolase
VHAAVDAVSSEAARLGATTTQESWTPTTTFDPRLVERLHGILPDAPMLGTGAGHDAGILATHGVPSAMLFVRNPTGVSHSPSESASLEDCHHGVTALTAVVTELCTGKDPESMSVAR